MTDDNIKTGEGIEKIDADTGNILEKIDAWLDGFLALIPNIGVALVVLVLFIIASHLVAKLIRRKAHKNDRDSLGEVSSSLVKWTIIFTGVILAVTIVVPTIKPGDILASFGIGSVAIGFAFKDILQNMLAGILILIRQPFSVGDQIVSGSHEGTVEKSKHEQHF